ncbi:hypothetical protein FSARC_9372 [Fusarium sarcochroum]|uniref:NACHT domain-containing protein n=1 Tax=Fusarium sarcochroum TaxID=1208366 RepID=A0A8H4TRM7_9HYPO|nr:hypothetical protein FSARC_9372 [Fusarium sarcochroum]
MEALGAAASVVAIIQIAERIAIACISYIDSVQGYPKDLRAIYVEINSLKIIFQSLRFFDPADDEDAAALRALEAPNGPVEGCKQAMQELSDLIPSATPTDKTRGHKRRKIRTTLDTLAWPMKTEKAGKLLSELMVHKSTINMALTGQLLQDIRIIKSDVRKTTHVLSDTQKREICNWFENTNPSSSHNAALNLYVGGTGDWVFRSQPWKDWIGFRTRSLWLHGIPGAGKTILAAHTTQAVMEYCRQTNNPRVTCVYYYCYHGHNQDETTSLIRWLLGQLFRKADHVPQGASDLFKSNREPDLQALKDLLQESLQRFERVFLMVDALDESQPHEDLLTFLQQLITGNEYRKIQLFTTSRQYTTIEKIMLKFSEPLSLSNPWVQEDIKCYVSVQIAETRAFHRWPVALRNKVKDRLSARANGMFRWAVCQLDILRRLKTTEEIEEALECLPETLDETYERIFAMIHPADRQLVRHAMTWICFHGSLSVPGDEVELTCSMLLETYWMCVEASGTVGSVILDTEMLKEICGCLLVYNTTKCGKEFPSFAHYTVREFLESDRLTSASSCFRILSPARYEDLLTIIFRQTVATRHDTRMIYPMDNLGDYCFFLAWNSFEKFEDLVPPTLAFDVLSLSSPFWDGTNPKLRRSSGNITMSGFDPKLTNAEVPAFWWCLQLLEFNCPHLLKACLQQSGMKEILGTRTSFMMPTQHIPGRQIAIDIRTKFHGSFMELVAICSAYAHLLSPENDAFCILLDRATG